METERLLEKIGLPVEPARPAWAPSPGRRRRLGSRACFGPESGPGRRRTRAAGYGLRVYRVAAAQKERRTCKSECTGVAGCSRALEYPSLAWGRRDWIMAQCLRRLA